MAVTTGTTTNSTNTKTSTAPSSGGSSLGSFSSVGAVSSRTSPSTGAGGQGSGNAKTSSSSSGTKSTTSSTGTAAKTSTSSAQSKSFSPTNSPGNAAPATRSAGIHADNAAATAKAKDQYSKYGGAQTSMRAATVGTKTSAPAPSAKVVDPSRNASIAKNGSGTDTSWGGSLKAPTSAPGKTSNLNSPVARDPSIAGRLADANKNYVVSQGPGGLVSRTYSDPDLKAKSPTVATTKGIDGLGEMLARAVDGPPRGPNRGLAQKSMAEQLGAASVDAYNRIKNGVSGYVDHLLGPGIKPGTTLAAAQNTPGMTPAKPALTTGMGPSSPLVGGMGPTQSLTVPGSIMGISYSGPQNLSQAVTGDYARYSAPRGENPEANVDFGDPAFNRAQLANAVSRANAGQTLGDYGQPAAGATKMTDRVPQQAPLDRSQLAGVGSSPQSLIDKARQDAFAKIAEARAAQPTVPTRGNSLTSVMHTSPKAQVRDIRNAVAVAQGPGERILSVENVPPEQTAPRAPTEVTITPESIGAQGGLGVFGYRRGQPGVSPLNVPNGSSTVQRDTFSFEDPTQTTQPVTPSRTDMPLTNPSRSTAPDNAAQPPSQQGDYLPDANPSQYDGPARNVREAWNRAQYEKARAKQGLKDLPGKLYDAIVNGDLRAYTGTENDKRDWPIRLNYNVPQGDSSQTTAALLAQLMAILQQSQSGISQADLVNKTFI